MSALPLSLSRPARLKIKPPNLPGKRDLLLLAVSASMVAQYLLGAFMMNRFPGNPLAALPAVPLVALVVFLSHVLSQD